MGLSELVEGPFQCRRQSPPQGPQNQGVNRFTFGTPVDRGNLQPDLLAAQAPASHERRGPAADPVVPPTVMLDLDLRWLSVNLDFAQLNPEHISRVL